MFDNADAILLARIQFAFTVSFHFLFPAFTIGLASYLAVLNLDAEPYVRRRAVSAAKITIARAARFVGQNAVQLHGGMGMTEELAIGHCFKRLTAIETEFGSATDHLRRYADAGSG